MQNGKLTPGVAATFEIQLRVGIDAAARRAPWLNG
jgi:hypothetical protein